MSKGKQRHLEAKVLYSDLLLNYIKRKKGLIPSCDFSLSTDRKKDFWGGLGALLMTLLTIKPIKQKLLANSRFFRLVYRLLG